MDLVKILDYGAGTVTFKLTLTSHEVFFAQLEYTDTDKLIIDDAEKGTIADKLVALEMLARKIEDQRKKYITGE